MRKIFTFLLTLVMVLGCVQVKANNDLTAQAGAAILIEASQQYILYAKN